MYSVYIAAPFGNYLRSRHTISVSGTFTVKKRPGLIKQIAKTLRYDFKDKCWYNALGLRNPGINYGVSKYREGTVVSIGALERQDYDLFNAIIPEHIPLEINVSCPNVDHYDIDFNGLSQLASRKPILKITPDISLDYIKRLIDMGYTRFHASNTLKTERGGRSGPILRDYTNNNINVIKSELKRKAYIIAGGGIQSINDAMSYISMGANAISLGTVCFNPIRLLRLLNDINRRRS